MDCSKNEQVSYKYKIEWLFPVANDLFGEHIIYKKNLYAVIKALGVTSFDSIKLKDSEGQTLDELIFKTSVSTKETNDEAIRYIRKRLKNTNIYYVELIKK